MTRFIKDTQYYRFCLYGFLEIGIVYTVREITRNVFEIPAGLAADVLGRKRTMVSAFALYIVSFILYSFSSGLAFILVATIIFGLGDAFRTGTHKAMIFDYLHLNGWTDQKVTYYGHTRSWSQAGSALSALTAAGLVFWSGEIGTVFIYSVIPYALGMVLMISYPSYLDGNAVRLREVKLGRAFLDTFRSFWHAFRTPRIFRGILNASVYSGYDRALKDYKQPVIQAFAISMPVLLALDDDRKSALMIGIIYFIIYFLSSATTRRSGRFAGLFKGYALPLNLTMLAGFAIGILCGLAIIRDMAILAILLFIGIYLLENLRLPAGISYFTENIDKDILATTLSAESQGKSLFTGVIALLTGFLADRFEIGTAVLVVSGIMLLVYPLALIRNGNKKHEAISPDTPPQK